MKTAGVLIEYQAPNGAGESAYLCLCGTELPEKDHESNGSEDSSTREARHWGCPTTGCPTVREAPASGALSFCLARIRAVAVPAAAPIRIHLRNPFFFVVPA